MELDRWKVTELLSFMLYWGPIVLKDCLAEELYENFMFFSVGMYLLLSSAIYEERVVYTQKFSKSSWFLLLNTLESYMAEMKLYSVYTRLFI